MVEVIRRAIKIGNAVGCILPKAYVDLLQIKEKDLIKVTIEKIAIDEKKKK